MRQNVSTGKLHFSSLLFILCIMILVVGIVMSFAFFTVRYASSTMENNLIVSLSTDAKSKAAALKLWLDGIQEESARFTNKDMIRLYCTESFVLDQQKDSGALPQWALQNESGRDLGQLRERFEQQLKAFIDEEKNIVNAGVWDANLTPILRTSEEVTQITPTQNLLLREALTTAKPVISSVTVNNKELILNMAYPIFPPAYTELDPEKPVAVMLTYVPVEHPLARILAMAENSKRPYRLLQWTEDDLDILQFIDLNTAALLPMGGWETSPRSALPLAKRNVASGDSVYSLGMPVEGYNFLVTHEELTTVAEEFYSKFRHFMIIFVSVSIGATAFVLIVGWWFLVGRNERAMERNLRKLHNDVTSQKQILDGINATLEDAVVLTDTLGNIQYANNSFSNAVNHQPESLYGYKMGNVMHPSAAEILQKFLDRVVRTEKTQTFEERLTILGKSKYFQGVCTPYFGDHKSVSGVVSVYRDVTKMVEERQIEQKRIDQLINVLTMAIELVNPYICGQSQAMSDLSVSLAKHLERPEEELKTLRIAASLSQIGMLSLPSNLLNKKGQLTQEERDLMRTHVNKTYDLLADFDFGLPIQGTIFQMYENMDGTGYPQQLKGEEISFLSRILNITNVFCAILRPRVYRKAKTLEDTLSILQKDAAQFDSTILDALKQYMATPEGKLFVQRLQSRIVNK